MLGTAGSAEGWGSAEVLDLMLSSGPPASSHVPKTCMLKIIEFFVGVNYLSVCAPGLADDKMHHNSLPKSTERGSNSPNEEKRLRKWTDGLMISPPLGKQQHRGGCSLSGGAHPEQRGEPPNRARARRHGPLGVRQCHQGAPRLLVMSQMTSPGLANHR